MINEHGKQVKKKFVRVGFKVNDLEDKAVKTFFRQLKSEVSLRHLICYMTGVEEFSHAALQRCRRKPVRGAYYAYITAELNEVLKCYLAEAGFKKLKRAVLFHVRFTIKHNRLEFLRRECKRERKLFHEAT